MDIAAWLRQLELEQYEPAFRANEIDWAVLPKLTSEDLREIGVVPIGHRRRMLDAIAVLAREPAAAPDSPLPTPGTTAVAGGRPGVPAHAGEGKMGVEAERRQLTVMFCDLVGSTELSTRFDPEDYREIIAVYHRTVTQTVTGFDGFVAKYMGDGVLAYFGYPRAHEDDAERAVRAGLGAVDAVGRLDVKSVKLQARLGIATGLVVVGDLIGEGSAQEQSVVGETPNLAARLQGLAEPNTVVIAAGTRRLVGDLFEYRDLGAIEVKGITAPVQAWQVLSPSAVASRFEALRGSVLTPLVGRDEEIALLLRRWARAKIGNGQVVLISGEPGIGKSRLIAALEERLHAERHGPLRFFCSPYFQNSALYPFVDQIWRAFGFARDEPPAIRLEKLEAMLVRTESFDEDAALLADQLLLPASNPHPLPSLSPQRKKERTLQALIRQFEGLVAGAFGPRIILLEDAHWIDPTSRELLDLMVQSVRELPMLLIVTFRQEFQPPWTGQPHVTMIALNRLDRRDGAALVEHIAGGKALPAEVVGQIIERTDGVPLFVEEFTKSVLESGAAQREIPTTLQASLMARLDRLGSARRIAQTGAAIGRQFSYELLRAVSDVPEDELRAALARLVASELVFQRGTPPEAVFTFKHALVQDAAHGSLLRSVRQQLHGRIAAALEAHSRELMESQPELFAQHYAEAGLVEKSVAYWGKASQRSTVRSAMAEAVAQLNKGLDQLALLPDTPERQRRELEFWSAVGAVLQAVKGQAAPETGHAYARARELWDQLGSPSEFLHIPHGQSLHHMFRGELDLAQRLDEDLLRLSRQRKDSVGLALGHYSTGRTLLFVGEFASSRFHLEQALALHDPVLYRSLARYAGSAPQVGAQAYLGIDLLCLGYLHQALVQSNAAIAEARRLAHPPSLAASLAIGALLLLLNGDNAALDERAGQLIAVATEQGFPRWHAQATICLGWVKVKNGEVVEGMSLLRSGLKAYRATGSLSWMPLYFALLARACEIAEQIEESSPLLDDALEIAGRTGERLLGAELNRHKGQSLSRQGQSEAAEELYRKALSIAREQEAKLWELRAAVNLARFWRDQGQHAEARGLLVPVYGWFTEGFDTPDLKEAKALLDEIESA
jgi:class 3 adenylate cyclase/predicted ATPase